MDLSLEHRDLVAQHQDLDLLGSITAQHQEQQLDGAPQHGASKRPEHGR
jgi:hypothetical protein